MSTRKLCLAVFLCIEIFSTIGSNLSGDQDPSLRDGLTDEDRLFDEFFTRRRYHRHSRPVANANNSVYVAMGISVLRIVDVNEKNEFLRTNMWLKLNWYDPKLTWEPSDYSGLNKISIPSHLVWVPDIILFDSAESGANVDDCNLLIDSNGFVDWYPKAIFASYCHINIALFPFDEQTCVLRFESWSYDSSKLNLSLRDEKPLALDNYKNNSEWDLIGTSARLILVKYTCCEMPYSVLEFGLHIRRRVLYYGYNLILPCTLISILAACTYILPPESGERIGLGITTLLALTVNQLVVADQIPPSSDALPLLGLYFGCVMIMNTLSVISMVFVSNMCSRSSALYPMSPSMKQFVCNRLGHLLRLRRLPSPDSNSKGITENDILHATTVDQNERDTKHKHQTFPNTSLSVEGGNINNCSEQWHRQRQPCSSLDDASNDDDDWKYAAHVIDRLCFCICVVYLTIVTLVFYTYAILARI